MHYDSCISSAPTEDLSDRSESYIAGTLSVVEPCSSTSNDDVIRENMKNVVSEENMSLLPQGFDQLMLQKLSALFSLG